MHDLASEKQALTLANRVVKAFDQPMTFNDADWLVTTSVGIAVLGDSASSAVDLMKCADIAMYRAKQEGRNQAHFYSSELHEYVRKRNLLEADIRHALANQQFILFYQAQVDTQNDKLIGMEALLRWQHPERGLIAPGEFLDVAEELGLMIEIGHWVLNSACQQLIRWHALMADSERLPVVAVNLSAVQLHNNQFFSNVDQILNNCGLPAQYVELEITESAIIKNPEKVAVVLQTLADRGVRLALDDFGTGYSSFEHLKLFPIHNLKIDRSFVGGIGLKSQEEKLLAAMINFARTLALKVTVEGVETLQQANFCQAKGADVIQGYYYAKPMAAQEFERCFIKSDN